MTKNAENTSAPYTSPPIAIILAIILLIFFFIVFFSIYFCRYFMEKLLYMWYFRRSPVGTPVGPAGANGSQGLDPLTIESFPAFPYSSVKDLRKEKYGLECAICLSEFLDDDILRLLTTCCHVFHQECIDLWLESHKTCPVCRMSLDALEKSPTNYCAKHEIDENEAIEDTFSITIKDDNDQDRGGKSDGAENLAEQSNESQNKREKFSRSHSTGHSIVRAKGAEDKFTLRLPEHLHAKIIRGHNWTGSCTTFGEYKSKTTIGNGGFGEVSDFSGGDVNKV